MNAKLANQMENASMTVVHVAEKPFYYVEEAERFHSNVTVHFYDENLEEWETTKRIIKTKSLTAYIEDNYSGYIDTGFSEDRVEDMRTPLQYLDDNLRDVVTEYLNSKSADLW